MIPRSLTCLVLVVKSFSSTVRRWSDNGTFYYLVVCLVGYLLRELTVDIGIAIISIMLVVAIGLGTMEVLLDDK